VITPDFNSQQKLTALAVHLVRTGTIAMSRFAKAFHLTCAIIATFTCVLWSVIVGVLVFYRREMSPHFNPAKFAFLLIPALIIGAGAAMEYSFYKDEREGKSSHEDESLVGSVGRGLLTSRLEILVAMGVTALLLGQALYSGTKAGSKVSLWLSVRGWSEIIVNCGMGWLGFLFIRDTMGRERIFFVGACLVFSCGRWEYCGRNWQCRSDISVPLDWLSRCS
jgi:hypothetical protein